MKCSNAGNWISSFVGRGVHQLLNTATFDDYAALAARHKRPPRRFRQRPICIRIYVYVLRFSFFLLLLFELLGSAGIMTVRRDYYSFVPFIGAVDAFMIEMKLDGNGEIITADELFSWFCFFSYVAVKRIRRANWRVFGRHCLRLSFFFQAAKQFESNLIRDEFPISSKKKKSIWKWLRTDQL